MKLLVGITADTLRIRQGASTSFPTVGYLHKGDEVYVDQKSEDGDFYHLFFNQGWVGVKYTNLISNAEDNTPAATLPVIPPPDTPTPTPPQNQIVKDYKAEHHIDYGAVKDIIDEGNKASIEFAQLSATVAQGTGIYDGQILMDFVNDSGFPSTVGVGDMQVVNYEIDYDFIRNNLDIVRKNLNVKLENSSIRDTLFEKFNRFKIAFPDLHLSKSFSHVFFTRPDLNIFDGSGTTLNLSLTDDPLYYFLNNNNPNLLKALTKDYAFDHDFHPYLSNQAESFELSDEFIKTLEHGETLTGYKVQYGKHNVESNSAGTFSVSYTDDRYASIYKTHKAWTEYISRVYRGAWTPKHDYILHKIIDYACSAYYFIVGPDGETILFWSKYFGVFPTNTPTSAFSWSKGSMVKMPQFNINYAYAFKEDFNPLALAEFNMNSSGNFVYKKTYEPNLIGTGRTISGPPFIETTKDALGQYVYKLRFRAG